MKESISYIDRKSGEKKIEKVYGQFALEFLYNGNVLGHSLAYLSAKLAFLSKLYGWWMSQPWTKKKIPSFIEKYHVDQSEFQDPVDSFRSFNDFFCRKLKPEARPIAESDAIIPTDGRYLVYPDISQSDGFLVKGKQFSLKALLQDGELAAKYEKGSLVMGRLNPSDYHRFHFPINCRASSPRLINGLLYSVNPISLKQNIHRLAENKRMITQLESEDFGKVLYLEVGATNVGAIHQTYDPSKNQKKGNEKGFFSFGGSTIILIFKNRSIKFPDDLLKHSSQRIETLCHMGQPLGSKY
ncbi:MAG: Phosphatidylserine decarboxylase proenzyme [Chlamydiae bacterium]|nr:Phosphatidylserine decarboxylase proenzyme [Chlamydiota bacterium]